MAGTLTLRKKIESEMHMRIPKIIYAASPLNPPKRRTLHANTPADVYQCINPWLLLLGATLLEQWCEIGEVQASRCGGGGGGKTEFLHGERPIGAANGRRQVTSTLDFALPVPNQYGPSRHLDLDKDVAGKPDGNDEY